MAYKVLTRLEEPGRKPRRATVKVASMAELRRATNALLKPGTKVTILKKTKVKL